MLTNKQVNASFLPSIANGQTPSTAGRYVRVAFAINGSNLQPAVYPDVPIGTFEDIDVVRRVVLLKPQYALWDGSLVDQALLRTD
jgi:hypothetical protein